MAYVTQRGKRFTGYYRDKNGLRYSAGTFDSKQEALSRAENAESRGGLGGYRMSMTLREYISVWLKTADLLPLTKKGYESVLTKHVLPIMGTRKVGEVTRPQVRDLLRRLALDGVSAEVRAHAKSALGSAFRELVESDLLENNPTHKITVKRRGRKTLNVLEPDEFKKIQQHLPNPAAQLFAKFLVTSGCRFGEATELRVDDLDLKSGDVYVERRVNDLGHEHNAGQRFLVVPGTKSGDGRMVTLSPALMLELQSHIKAHNLNSRDLLFPKSVVAVKCESKRKSEKPLDYVDCHGTRYAYTRLGCRCDECRKANADYRKQQRSMHRHPSNREMFGLGSDHLPRDVWRKIWVGAIIKAGMSWIPRTHDLRHANATLLLKNGVDLHEVKERLGHSSVQTTERYLHRLRHQSSNAANAVVEFL